MEIISTTNISEYELISRGKVRDIYAIDNGTLLLVTTDRMSAFDVVMNEAIPYKGVVLNQMTIFWMQKFEKLIANHILEIDVDNFPKPLKKYKNMLEGRSVLAKRAKPLPIECIVRGHITGSGWKDYKSTGAVCGIKLPTGLVESDKLAKPLFTPSTKAELGQHDENISLDQAKKILGEKLTEQVEQASIEIFREAREMAEARGIIIADTKFEFGKYNGALILIDEVLTPDSSRFWSIALYEAGKSQPSFDKQYLRDYLLSLDWNQAPPPPSLPKEIIENTSKKYFDAYQMITGQDLGIGV